MAIVTGGAASIGAGITRALHAQGARVIVVARSVHKGQAIAAEPGERADFVATDIIDNAALRALVDGTIAGFGHLDILANTACFYGDDGPATARAVWLDTLNVNAVWAAILGEIARPHLATRGNIVAIGSISGRYRAKSRISGGGPISWPRRRCGICPRRRR